MAGGDLWIHKLPDELYDSHAINSTYEPGRQDYDDFWRNKACLSADAKTRRFWRDDLIRSKNREADEGAVFSGKKS